MVEFAQTQYGRIVLDLIEDRRAALFESVDSLRDGTRVFLLQAIHALGGDVRTRKNLTEWFNNHADEPEFDVVAYREGVRGLRRVTAEKFRDYLHGHKQLPTRSGQAFAKGIRRLFAEGRVFPFTTVADMKDQRGYLLCDFLAPHAQQYRERVRSWYRNRKEQPGFFTVAYSQSRPLWAGLGAVLRPYLEQHYYEELPTNEERNDCVPLDELLEVACKSRTVSRMARDRPLASFRFYLVAQAKDRILNGGGDITGFDDALEFFRSQRPICFIKNTWQGVYGPELSVTGRTLYDVAVASDTLEALAVDGIAYVDSAKERRLWNNPCRSK